MLLDALNQLSDGHDLNWLPQHVGPNVRVIISCVQDPAATAESPEQCVLRSLTSRYPTNLRVPLAGLTSDDVKAIVVDYLHEYCKELDTPHINALCQLPQANNPLYLLVALGELRTLGGNDMNKIVPQLITSLDKEYPDTVSLFRWVLRRLEVFGEEAVRWWSLYLACSRIGMASHELADLLTRKLGLDAALSALRIERGLRRYLHHRGNQLDFFHSQLRQAVLEQYGPQTEETDVHKDIALYFRDLADPQNNQTWNSSNPRAISELPYHAWKANFRDMLYLLTRDDSYLKTQQRLISEDPDMPLRTIRYAIDAACEAQEPVRMAEFTLKHANFLTQQSRETPLDALLNPDLPPQVAMKRAWKLADLLDNQQRSYALLLLTWKLQQLQRDDEAAATLALMDLEKTIQLKETVPVAAFILSRIKPIKGIDLKCIAMALFKDGRLCNLTNYLIEANQFSEALRAADWIENTEERARVLRNIASAQTQAGQDSSETFAKALRTAEQIEDEYWLHATLKTISDAQVQAQAHAQVQAGKFDEAFRTAEIIESPEVLASIAVAQAQAGQDPSKALALALRIANASYIARPLFKIVASAQAQVGKFDEAFRIADKSKSVYGHSEVLASIALAQAQAGEFDEAFRTADKIRILEDHFRALQAISSAQAQTGQFDKAFQTAGLIEDAFWKSEALIAIAVAQAQTGQDSSETFAKALSTASHIRDAKGLRGFSEAFMDIAIAQSRTGQDPTETLAQVLRTSSQIEDAFWHSLALNDFAGVQDQAGQDPTETFAQALWIANKILNTTHRHNAFIEIALGQIQAGVLADALQTVEKIENVYGRSKVLASIALAQAQAGQDPKEAFAQALRSAEKVVNPKHRHKAFKYIVNAQTQAGRFAEAFVTAKKIEDAWERSKLLRAASEIGSAIAKAQAQVRQFAEALSNTNKIEDAYWRSKALIDIAKTQVQTGQDPTKTFAEAFRTAGQIDDTDGQSESLTNIAGAQTQAGHDPTKTFSQALRSANQIMDTILQRKAFDAIAFAQAQAGQFTEALLTVEKIEDVKDRSKTFVDIARAQAEAGQFAEALLTAEKIVGVYCRSEALAGIAQAQTQAGQFAEALSTARRIDDASSRSKALETIASAQAQAGQDPTETFAEALHPASLIENAWVRSKTFVDIASAQAQVGQDPTKTFAEALSTAEKIEDAWERSNAFRDIASAQAQAGQFTEAIRISDTISIFSSSCSCLIDLARIYKNSSLTAKPSILKELLPRSANYLKSAYRACGLLAHLYPFATADIVKLLGAGSASDDK